MKKSEKIISEFFKPYFEKHPSMESLFFLIYNSNDVIYLAEEDCGINGSRWDELSDQKMYESSFAIQKAIEYLEESKVDALDIIEQLKGAGAEGILVVPIEKMIL